jgi:formylglycine-generating enzyme required for sulfatase activity
MQTPAVLLRSLGAAILAGNEARAVDDPIIEGDAGLARTAWASWARAADEGQRLAELQALAGMPAAEAARAVAQVVGTLAANRREPAQQALRGYLIHVPAAIRQTFRRPADPSGTTPPSWIALRGPADLLAVLPARTPWFSPGDVAGDWELEELLQAGTVGETWKARAAGGSESPPAVLRFCLHPALQQALRDHGADLLERVRSLGEQPGILPLRQVFLEVEPPALLYDYFEAGDLAALARAWHAEPGGPAPAEVAGLVRRLAEALAPLHRLDPPLVHRGLRPSCILVRGSGATLTCKIADLGLGALLPARPAGSEQTAADSAVYVSPEQARGLPAQPRDDVYALSVLWYQLLTGNLAAGRPGGSAWRRKLAERGMASGLIDLLEAGFEDDPEYRPADASVLAARLGELLAPPTQPSAPRRPAALASLLGGSSPQPAPAQPVAAPASAGESSGRLRPRRSDVWQVFDALEKPEAEVAKLLTNSVGLKLVLIQAGSFAMGSPPTEPGRCAKEGPQHEVTLTTPFYLGVYPVTQEQYQKVSGRNPSRFHADAGGGPEHPVENVTWEDAVEFCRRLSALPAEREAGHAYRLPTEAEWEYACRGGTTTAFCYGDTLSSTQGNFDGAFPYGDAPRGPAAQKTTRVGLYLPNLFGLHDMHGNVWEWCSDWHDSDWYRHSPRRNPQGPSTGQFRVLRGGCWRSHAATCRSAYRNGLLPKGRDRYTGFRVVLEVPTQ